MNKARQSPPSLLLSRLIAPGTSLRLRYGELSNEELLLGLGFVLYHNPFDRLVVPPRG